jgi:hypothetical protein
MLMLASRRGKWKRGRRKVESGKICFSFGFWFLNFEARGFPFHVELFTFDCSLNRVTAVRIVTHQFAFAQGQRAPAMTFNNIPRVCRHDNGRAAQVDLV